MKKKRFQYLSLGCIFVFFILIGCNFYPQKVLKIGTNVWSGYEIFYLARSLGYYETTPIKIVELPSATDVSHAFRHQLIDVAALTLDEALTLLQSENDIKIILVIDISLGGDALLAKPEIKQLSDLKGKRVGVENVAVGAILLDGALNAAGLKPSDIEIIPLSVDEHLIAYQTDKIDAVVTFEPIKNQLLNLNAIQLFDSSQIPNRIVDVLVTRESVIEEKSYLLRYLLQAYFKALDYFEEKPNEAAIKMANRLSVHPTEVAILFSGLKLPNLEENHRLLFGTEAKLKQSVKILTTLMLQKKLLIQPIEIDNLIEGDFLPKKDKANL